MQHHIGHLDQLLVVIMVQKSFATPSSLPSRQRWRIVIQERVHKSELALQS